MPTEQIFNNDLEYKIIEQSKPTDDDTFYVKFHVSPTKQ